MDILKRFDEVLEYIEQHLLEEMDNKEITKIAGCSWYSFQRMFSYVIGISLSEYIRNRKMSNAGFDLLESKNKIIDIALKYGYTSPTSFNRAFQSVHGFSPSKAKEKSKELVVYPRIHLRISVSGNKSIKYRVENKPQMMFFGKSYRLSEDIESNFQNSPLFWENFMANKEIDKLSSYKQCLNDYVYGITTYQEGLINNYIIGLKTESEISDEKEYEQIVIPPQAWLILTNKGIMPEAIIHMYQKFYNEWLPVADYEYDVNADVEVYPINLEDACEYELWLPIRKKEKKNE